MAAAGSWAVLVREEGSLRRQRGFRVSGTPGPSTFGLPSSGYRPWVLCLAEVCGYGVYCQNFSAGIRSGEHLNHIRVCVYV